MKKYLDNNITFLYPELMKIGNDLEAPLCKLPENTCLFATARDGLSYVAQNYECTTKRVLMPSYSCETVYLPFTKAGYTCAYYAMDKQLRIVPEHFLALLENFRPDVIVVHPLYGLNLNEAELELLKKAKEQGCFIVEDLTQSLFSKKRYDFIDAYVGSMRKYFNIPDGGFYESATLPPPENWEELPEKEAFVQLMTDQLYLRGAWERGGDYQLRTIAGHLEKLAVQENRKSWDVYRISDFSRRLLVHEDPEANNARRLANARYLYEHLKDSKVVDMPYTDISDISSGPLWFPVYIKGDNRKDFKTERKLLPKDCGIFAPGLWGIETPAVVVDDTVRYIYDHILAFPCGQMYGETDMQYIVDCIEGKFLK